MFEHWPPWSHLQMAWWMPPSLVPTKQIKNHKIWKEDEKKIIYKIKESDKLKEKKKKPKAQAQVSFWTQAWVWGLFAQPMNINKKREKKLELKLMFFLNLLATFDIKSSLETFAKKWKKKTRAQAQVWFWIWTWTWVPQPQPSYF